PVQPGPPALILGVQKFIQSAIEGKLFEEFSFPRTILLKRHAALRVSAYILLKLVEQNLQKPLLELADAFVFDKFRVPQIRNFALHRFRRELAFRDVAS